MSKSGNSGKNSNSDSGYFKEYCAALSVCAVLGTCGYLIYNQRNENILRDKQRQEQREADLAKQNINNQPFTPQSSDKQSRNTSNRNRQPISPPRSSERIDFDRDFRKLKEKLNDDLDILGLIQTRRSDHGEELLDFEDFCRIMKVKDKYNCEALWPSLRILIHQRRQALLNNDF